MKFRPIRYKPKRKNIAKYNKRVDWYNWFSNKAYEMEFYY